MAHEHRAESIEELRDDLEGARGLGGRIRGGEGARARVVDHHRRRGSD